MNANSSAMLLEQAVLQHRPIYDRQRNFKALDLQVRSDPPVAAADWLAALRNGFAQSRLVNSELLVLHARDVIDLQRLAEAPPHAGAVVGLDHEVARHPASAPAISALHKLKTRFWCERGPGSAWPVGAATWVSSSEGGKARLASGLTMLDQFDAAFAAGAAVAHGWPVRGTVTPGSKPLSSDVKVAIELLGAIDRAASISEIEALVNRSPTLSFRLMAFLSSPSCGVVPRDASLRHALMMLGMAQLRQWVSLLVTAVAGTPATVPLVHASIWRAHFLQALGEAVGPSMPPIDLFVCGAFSLLDQLMGAPMATLMKELPLAEEAHACLVDGQGPLAPYLALARAVEADEPLDMAAAVDATLLTPSEINRAVLQAWGLAIDAIR